MCPAALPQGSRHDRKFCEDCAAERNRQSAVRSQARNPRVPVPPKEKPCEGCGQPFFGTGRNRYCKPECKKQALATKRSKQWDEDPAHRLKLENRHKRWRESDPENYSLCLKKSSLKTNYGLSWEDFERMRTEQNLSCKVCNTHESELTKGLCVDHCHITGVVRGLLCTNCNTAIGLLKDSAQTVEAAAQYLRQTEVLRVA